jgi:hypothetical protein
MRRSARVTEIDDQIALETTSAALRIRTFALRRRAQRCRSRLGGAERLAGAEQALERQRRETAGAERDCQEAEFQRKTCAAKLTSGEPALDRGVARGVSLAELKTELVRFDERRSVRRSGVSRAAGEREGRWPTAGEPWRRPGEPAGAEEERFASGRNCPLRERIGELRLKEQEAAQKRVRASAQKTGPMRPRRRPVGEERALALNGEIARLAARSRPWAR